MKKEQKYCIGLDIGTNSVGWCVTDENNNILKRRQKLLRGIRTFDEANSASIARMYRGARRLKLRKKQRIRLLQEIMANDVLAKDENFYFKLSETGKWLVDRKDKSSQFNLFKEIDFNDKEYYKKYPTIYHLRKHLIDSSEKEDIRLVYLAIHHIIKYRGNFIYEGQEFKSGNSNINECLKHLNEFLELRDIFLNDGKSEDDIANILKDANIKRKEKEDKTKRLYDDSANKILTNVIKLILGYKVDLDKVFNIGEKVEIELSKDFDEEDINRKLGNSQTDFENMRNIYSEIILSNILNGVNYISESFIRKYDKYHDDLKILKKVYKESLPEKYNYMFREEGKNKKTYYTYNIRNVCNQKREKCATKASEKCSQEELLKAIHEDIKALNTQDAINILNEIEKGEFLIKLNTVNNSSIPYQIHKKELELIIDNQSKYYQTLKENKDKIIKLLEFRIPYYVGPLSNTKTKFAWMVRKDEGKIYPWNFEEKVDVNQSAENFITRMTNKCTYLNDKDVIPKNSLLYSEYCVLNEINNIRISDAKNNIRNKKLGIDAKKDIIENLFMKKKKVTVKELKKYLVDCQIYSDDVIISGLSNETEFISTLASYNDFIRIFGKINEQNYDMIEKIIYWRTVFETNDILMDKIKSKYTNITQEQIKMICKLKYSGWSSLSKELLLDFKSYDNETIMELLRNTQMNFMQIITDKKIGIGKQLEEYMKQGTNNKSVKEVISDLQGSPALKRGIWQSYLIVDELIKVMGCQPYNIYIEMAKSDDKKVRTISRYERLKKMYEVISGENEDYRAIYQELKSLSNDSAKNLSEQMYLYYIQNGKCLYSGETLHINTLSQECQIDHILPRAFIKNDSLDNKALVKNEYNQKKSDNLVLDEKIRIKQINWWMQLLKYGLITKEKFNALTKNTITEKEKAGFINRQLVETRQITKHVANILTARFPKTNVYSLKASLVTQFRRKYDIIKNRNVNLFHHADDAYILSVVGNYIEKTFPKEKNEFVYDEYVNRFSKIDKDKILKMQYGAIIESFNNDTEQWNHEIELKRVKDNIRKRDYLITKKLEENTGEFYNQTIYDHNYSSNSKIELKKGMDTAKYGCRTSSNDAYMCIIKYLDGHDYKKELIGIPITIATDIKSKKTQEEKNNALKAYIKEYLKGKDFEILKDRILSYQLIQNQNGHLYRLVSKKQLNNAKQLILPNDMVKFLSECSDEKNKNHIESIKNEQNMLKIYKLLLDKIEKQYLDYRAEYQNLKDGYEIFEKLETKEKIKALNEIISILGVKYGKISFIDKGGQGCKYFNTVFEIDTMTIIDQSVTGIFERRYRVNELESSSSN